MRLPLHRFLNLHKVFSFREQIRYAAESVTDPPSCELFISFFIREGLLGESFVNRGLQHLECELTMVLWHYLKPQMSGAKTRLWFNILAISGSFFQAVSLGDALSDCFYFCLSFD
jgi:hypothetical protein